MKRTITITPTFRSLMAHMLEVVKGKPSNNQAEVISEIHRVARMADALPMATDLLEEIKQRNPNEAVAIDAVMQQIANLVGE